MGEARAIALAIMVGALLPPSASAQCVLEGQAMAREVRPDGTALSLTVHEQARITFGARAARVEGLRPIAFAGAAPNGAVDVESARALRVHGVLELAVGTALRVVRGTRGSVEIAIEPHGVVVPTFLLPCDDVALGGAHAASDVPEPGEGSGELVRARGRELRVLESSRGRRGLRLRARGDASPLDALEVLGVEGTRLHVRATLDRGIALDGWVEARDVEAIPEDAAYSGSGCGCDASYDRCLTVHAGTAVYEGAVTLRAGTELRERRVVWGRVVEDVRGLVHVVRWQGREEVFVRSAQGLSTGACGDLATVERALVEIPVPPRR